MEEVVYDGAGQLLTGSLMDYAIPKADQLPVLAVALDAHPSTINPLGVKGVGESGAIRVCRDRERRGGRGRGPRRDHPRSAGHPRHDCSPFSLDNQKLPRRRVPRHAGATVAESAQSAAR